MTVPELLAKALTGDASRPFLTFYDESTGERVELSLATTANWVAKTANLLQDTLGADDSTIVRIDLPLHWETQVWLLACWSAGCAVTTGRGAPADIAVVGPGGWDGVSAEDIVALSLRPLGARFAVPVPAHVMDYNAEVLGHGDRFRAYYPPEAATTALVVGTDHITQTALVERSWGSVRIGSRALLAGATGGIDRQIDALVAALGADASLVLVAHEAPLTDERRREIIGAERVTAEL